VSHHTWTELFMFAAHWLALWLGLYLLSRRPRFAAGILLGIAFVALSTYFVSSAQLVAPEPVPGPDLWGIWLGSWAPAAPALLVHAFLALTGQRLAHQRALLIVVYAAAAVVLAASLNDVLIYRFVPALPNATTDVNGTLERGPLYPLYVTQVTGTLAIALWIIVRARRDTQSAPAQVRPALDWLIVGTSLMLAAAVAMFAIAASGGTLQNESLVDPVLGLGAIIVAVPFARYPGLIEGQLLRSDMRSSLLGAVVLMTAFSAVVIAAGGSFQALAGLGWLVLAVYVFADDLRALTDRLFYGSGSRAGRAGLRTTASYAGSERALDIAALTPDQARGVAGYLEALDRAGFATAQLERAGDPRLELLGREEFAPVRRALGLPASWEPGDTLSLEDVSAAVAESLKPRERQALGLKYLGYSDKEMAQLMGLKPNVPRSYLGDAKRKLNLAAGAQLMLFVHFSDLVERDALPLLADGPQDDEAAGADDPATADAPTTGDAPKVERPVVRTGDARRPGATANGVSLAAPGNNARVQQARSRHEDDETSAPTAGGPEG